MIESEDPLDCKFWTETEDSINNDIRLQFPAIFACITVSATDLRQMGTVKAFILCLEAELSKDQIRDLAIELFKEELVVVNDGAMDTDTFIKTHLKGKTKYLSYNQFEAAFSRAQMEVDMKKQMLESRAAEKRELSPAEEKAAMKAALNQW